MAVLAYVPALLASPGRMPSDSKLYLYLDPGRLISDALHSFDPRQFAGWVPHQHIAYLWPSGPWFWAFDWAGVPDWVAHRLWLGTLLFAAGMGVRWLAGLLGLAATAALAAALVYQLSPYILPYSSRTSVMLLPWAGLGWIVGLTILAAIRSTWRHAAILALVVLTVGAVNATALLMIVPAPALWLAHAAWARQISWSRAALVSVRVGLLCTAVSLWWIAALVIQGRYGAEVLAYSETLEAVSFTSTATEVLRGLGYWLFYVRDPYAATTTASADYLVSGRVVLTGVILLVVCLAGIVLVRWSHRRYAAMLVTVGVVLAVGVHPIDDRSPLMNLLVGDTRSGLALALRSSTRAVPVVVLGLALGAGALVSALGAAGGAAPTRRWKEHLALAVVGVLAVINLPALWTGGLVDPALERDQDPPTAWVEAAELLDASPTGYRVLQLPGAEFGAFRWGYTVDQPLPGLTDRAMVTRDLLPLGSPAAMDLLYAFDDRFQRGVGESAAVAPIARLFGADVVWLTNDIAYDRFRTPRPDVVAELVRSAPGTSWRRVFGTRGPNLADVPMLDEQSIQLGTPPGPLAPVELIGIEDPVAVIRARDTSVLIAGNGDGVVDAAAAGLIDGTRLIRYAASVEPAELRPAIQDAELVIITDTNRPRARHWRSSQDTTGFTEDGSDTPPLLVPDTADQRFELFDPDRVGHQTTAHQLGPVTARASGYGEPFAYRPEHRAVHAIDGDDATSWRVADRFSAIGERIELQIQGTELVEGIRLRQPQTPAGARRITEVELTTPRNEAQRVALDAASLSNVGQYLELVPFAGPASVMITITATEADPSHPEAFGAVGFARIDLGLGAASEVVRLPQDALDLISADTPVAVVMTRERVRPTDRWRSDPEPRLVREFQLPMQRGLDLAVTVRLDQRASDAVIAGLLGLSEAPVRASSSDRLTGVATAGAWAALDGNQQTAWTSPFGSALGSQLRVRAGTSQAEVAVIRQPVQAWNSLITEIQITDSEGVAQRHVWDRDPSGQPLDTTTVPLGALSGPELLIEVTGVDERMTVDRRYGEPVVLPVAISSIEFDEVEPVQMPELLDTGCREDLISIDGRPYPIRISASVTDLLAGAAVQAEPCTEGPVMFEPGRHLLTTTSGSETGLQVDRVTLATPSAPAMEADTAAVRTPPPLSATAPSAPAPSAPAPSAPAPSAPAPSATVLEANRTERTVRVRDCPDGCWLVLGEGVNQGWSARIGDTDLGDPVLVDGGFNGWWIDAELTGRGATAVVDLIWTPQRTLTIALILSAASILVCLVLILGDPRRAPTRARTWTPQSFATPGAPSAAPSAGPPAAASPVLASWTQSTRRPLLVVTLGWALMAALVVGPVWALPALGLGALMVATRTARPIGLATLALAATGGLMMVWRVIADRPAPNAGWVLSFEDLHRPALFMVTALLAASVLSDPREQPRKQARGQPH